MNNIEIAMSNRNNNLDALKLILAILVVFRHAPSLYQYEIMPITTCAVPAFLMVSGYLTYSKQVTAERLFRNARRITKILLWSLVFFYVYYLVWHPYPYSFTIKDVVVLVLLNDVPFAGHLWYLTAYIYTLLAIGFLYKINKQKTLKHLIPALIVTYFICDLAFMHSGIKYSLTGVFMFRDWLFMGLPFFIAGGFINRKKLKIRFPLCILLVVFLSILAVFEYFAIGIERHVSDIFFTTWPLAISILLLAISGIQFSQFIANQGRKYSLYIYLFHPAVIPFVKNYYIKGGTISDFLQPLIVVIITWIVSVLFVHSRDYLYTFFYSTKK